jgi:hypothetical protein
LEDCSVFGNFVIILIHTAGGLGVSPGL